MIKRIINILLTAILAISCCFFLSGCESTEAKELREFKQQQIELFNQSIENYYAVKYDNSFPNPEYYEYYLNDIQKKTVEQIQNAATKEDTKNIVNAANSEIRMVSYNYNHIAAVNGFSFQNRETANEIAEYDDGAVRLSVSILIVTSPLSSLQPLLAIRVTMSSGIGAKVFFGNGLTFLTPQTDKTFDPNGYPSNKETVSSPFAVSSGDSEETYILFVQTADPIIFKADGIPTYNTDHDFYFSIVFEKDGFVTGYCSYNYFDKTTYDLEPVKTIVYGEDFRNQVTEEKALSYIEQAKHGNDGEASEGIDYAVMGKLYVADRKNADSFLIYNAYMAGNTKRYFEIAYENSPNKIRIALPEDAAFTLSSQNGKFTLGGVTSNTVSPGIGDVVTYENDSGQIDFITGYLQPTVFDTGNAIDPFVYNSFFCVFAVQPSGTKPYASNSLAFKTLAVKFFTFADGTVIDEEKQNVLMIFDIITRSAFGYYKSEYLKN